MSRLKQAIGAATFADVGRELGLTTSAYANRKKADSIPYESLIPFAHSRQLSLEWLLFGEGSPRRDAEHLARDIPEVDSGLITQIFVAVARTVSDSPTREQLVEVGKWAGLAGLIYNKVVHAQPALREASIRQLAEDFGRAARIMREPSADSNPYRQERAPPMMVHDADHPPAPTRSRAKPKGEQR